MHNNSSTHTMYHRNCFTKSVAISWQESRKEGSNRLTSFYQKTSITDLTHIIKAIAEQRYMKSLLNTTLGLADRLSVWTTSMCCTKNMIKIVMNNEGNITFICINPCFQPNNLLENVKHGLGTLHAAKWTVKHFSEKHNSYSLKEQAI